MPSPTMPTGTVSGGSNGSQTFPIRDERRFDGAPDARDARDDSRVAADDADARTDGRGDGSPSLETEVERLRAENRDLRRALRETKKQRQDVIDRYERLIGGEAADRPQTAAAPPDAPPDAPSPEELARAPSSSRASPDPTPVFRRLAETLDEQWTRLRRRYKAWERQSGL